MAGIDLIPRHYALQRRLWRRCKHFAAAALALVCLVAAARAALWLGDAHEQRQLAELRKNEQISADGLAKVREFEQRKTAAQKELTALDHLRGRDRVRMLVQALDGAYLNGIWFDEIRSFRPGSPPTANGQAAAPANGAPTANPQQPGAAPAAAAAVPGDQRIELAGHATEHARLAAFMTRLSAQPAVSEVRLLDTSSSGDASESLIDFRMSLAIVGARLP